MNVAGCIRHVTDTANSWQQLIDQTVPAGNRGGGDIHHVKNGVKVVMGQEKLYIEKELSWLSFNERVLQEAADKSNPLIERMRFLGIYSNNLDEFYKVRFAELKRRIIISEEQGSNSHSRHLLGKIQSRFYDRLTA